MITKEQFIAQAAERSKGIPTEWGVQIGSRRRIALPCHCSSEVCEGWALLRPESVAAHLEDEKDRSNGNA